jgi:hypothetical protein
MDRREPSFSYPLGLEESGGFRPRIVFETHTSVKERLVHLLANHRT